MADLRAIELAIELATRQRDALARQHAQKIRDFDFARSQMSHLEGYAKDTDARWTHGSGNALTGELVRHHHQFVDRLQQAIGMQTGVMDGLQGQIDAALQALLKAEFRLSGLNQVLKARQAAVLARQKRQEQRQTDEFAALRHGQTRSPVQHGDHYDH